MTPAVFFDFAKTYFLLGVTGRRWIRSLNKGKGRRPKGGHFPLIENRRGRRELIQKLLICDRVFRDLVPGNAAFSPDRRCDGIYGRWVPFALINLLIRCRLLDAYGVVYDLSAETRLTKLVFLMRAWNDLPEIHGADALFDAVDSNSETAPPFSLLRRMFDATHQSASAQEYPTYDTLRRAWNKRDPGFGPPDPSETRLQAVATYSLRIGYAIMFPQIPERLSGALRPFGQWLYGLDELSDLHRDKAARTETYFGTLLNPIAEIRRLYAVCEDRFSKEASAPERVLPFMKFFTEEAVRAHEKGIDLESEILGAPGPLS